jgi:hypothetical protein
MSSSSNSASTIMNVTYGIEIADQDDRYITVAETALDGMAKAANPGAFLVDIFPIRTSLHFDDYSATRLTCPQ